MTQSIHIVALLALAGAFVPAAYADNEASVCGATTIGQPLAIKARAVVLGEPASLAALGPAMRAVQRESKTIEIWYDIYHTSERARFTGASAFKIIAGEIPTLP